MPDIAEKLKEMYEASSYTSWNELRDDVFIIHVDNDVVQRDLHGCDPTHGGADEQLPVKRR